MPRPRLLTRRPGPAAPTTGAHLRLRRPGRPGRAPGRCVRLPPPGKVPAAPGASGRGPEQRRERRRRQREQPTSGAAHPELLPDPLPLPPPPPPPPPATSLRHRRGVDGVTALHGQGYGGARGIPPLEQVVPSAVGAPPPRSPCHPAAGSSGWLELCAPAWRPGSEGGGGSSEVEDGRDLRLGPCPRSPGAPGPEGRRLDLPAKPLYRAVATGPFASPRARPPSPARRPADSARPHRGILDLQATSPSRTSQVPVLDPSLPRPLPCLGLVSFSLKQGSWNSKGLSDSQAAAQVMVLAIKRWRV